MIENDIAKSLGIGSGIDSKALVKQLTEIERAAPQARIDSRRDKAEAQISDFGKLASAITTLKSSLTALSKPEGMFSKNATFTESEALIPTKLDTDVQPGTYSFEVLGVAQSQSLSFEGFAETSSAVGEGVLTFNFGEWDRITDPMDSDYGDPTTFTADVNQDSFTVTIDSSNNTLTGLRDAINDADMGVQASIINDGTHYRLVVAAPSGAEKELEITASEAGGGALNTDATGLSRFAHNSSITGFEDTETQSGSDAEVKINGLTVTRSSNSVSDIVPGLGLDILKASPGEIITVTVSDDKSFAEENVRAFVTAYNAFLEEIDPLFGVDPETEEVGSLKNDTLAKSVLSRFRSIIASEIPGLSDSDFTALTNVGIRTELDGTLAINEDDFRTAFDDHFESVQKLFAPRTHSSESDIEINSYAKQTKAGSYDVIITTQPTKGKLSGGDVDAGVVFPNYDPAGKTYSMTVALNGTTSGSISIPTNVTYATIDDLATAMEEAINADSAIDAAGAALTVSAVFDSGTGTYSFELTSTRYGTSSSVNITAASADLIADLGLNVATGTTGVNVAGTVDGVAGFGLGNVLRPKLGSDADGLSMIIGDNATTSTVSFSRGFAGQMEELMNTFLANNGLFDQREEVLERQVTTADDDEKSLERRMSAFQERLMRQFIAMESILNGLSSQGGFLDNLIDTLPFTAQRD
jgi:flagellar hook-associated protein 2